MLHQTRWTPQKIAQRLKLIAPLVHRRRLPLPPFRYHTLPSPQATPPVAVDVDDSAWEVVEPNTYWGTWMTDFALRTRFHVPPDWETDKAVALYLPLGDAGDFCHPETLAYLDGVPYASADRYHQEILLPAPFRDGQTHVLALHGWTGLGGALEGDPHTKLFMRECAVVQVDQPTRDLVAMVRITLDVAARLDDNSPTKGRLYNALDEAFKTLDTRDPLGTAAFYESVPAALEVLREGVHSAGPPLDVDIIGVGHAHMDVAWLWTLGQTRRKVGRTFSNALRLMEQYPDFKFSQSQAQLYRYAEEDYPQIFAEIKQRVAEGRWEVMGGSWVEMDCNTSGAESLARQFLLGRGYFRQHFGDVDTPVLWLPDTFGYSWALPQLIKQAGLKYFVTHKMSWNQYNQMPYQLLWWQGIDGTRVLTHFLTTPAFSELLPHGTTYGSTLTARDALGTWENFLQKETYNELIIAYGYGDGGGGPTREMVENAHVLADHPGAPRVRAGTVREFMERIEQRVADRLPVWNGEFYLEYHRGTLTSQSRTKRNNRKSEFLLHDAEFLATWAALVTDYAYPHDALREAWELVCLNQFHDILPGSSIGAVYEDSERDYATVRRLGESVRQAALEALAQTLPVGTAFVAVNPTSFGGDRFGLLAETLPQGTRLVDARTEAALPTQAVEGGTLVALEALPPYALFPLRAEAGAPPEVDNTLHVSESLLENAQLRVEFNAQGEITRILDKEIGREVLPQGATANVLQAFEDRPMDFDAWDIDIFFDDRLEVVRAVESVRVIESGPLRAGLEIRRRYRNSQIVQKIYLHRDGKQLDFDTWLDWHEQHMLLKVAFPIDVLSTTATFDIQWGNVQRPTHRNTAWDWARFETYAHKWVDLSESTYGVALLNDCKYGHDVRDNVIRLTLLKSATLPDPNADQGEHRMTYSLLPHIGDWRQGVIPAGYALNDPVIVQRVRGESTEQTPMPPFVAVDAPNVVVETIKQAEDGQGVIVRLYETERARGQVTLRTAFPLQAAYRCNLLEACEEALEVLDGQRVAFHVTPYQIVTLRLIPSGV